MLKGKPLVSFMFPERVSQNITLKW